MVENEGRKERNGNFKNRTLNYTQQTHMHFICKKSSPVFIFYKNKFILKINRVNVYTSMSSHQNHIKPTLSFASLSLSECYHPFSLHFIAGFNNAVMKVFICIYNAYKHHNDVPEIGKNSCL